MKQQAYIRPEAEIKRFGDNDVIRTSAIELPDVKVSLDSGLGNLNG
jgi:hypothetical protein